MFWNFGWSEEIKTNPEELKTVISGLEKEFPGLEKLSSWTKRVQPFLENPPTANPNEVLTILRNLATKENFQITESANQGGEPPKIILAGTGEYPTCAKILNELRNVAAAQTERITLEQKDDREIEVRMEARIRNGGWYGDSPDFEKEKPEPELESSQISELGKTDLFNIPVIPKPVTVNKPRIKYIGFYNEKGTPTVFIEENGKTSVLTVGESLSTGWKIKEATIDQVVVTRKGATWTYQMEKAR